MACLWTRLTLAITTMVWLLSIFYSVILFGRRTHHVSCVTCRARQQNSISCPSDVPILYCLVETQWYSNCIQVYHTCFARYRWEDCRVWSKTWSHGKRLYYFFSSIKTAAFRFYCLRTRVERRYSDDKGTRVSETLCENPQKPRQALTRKGNSYYKRGRSDPIFPFFNCVDIKITANNNILYYNIIYNVIF